MLSTAVSFIDPNNTVYATAASNLTQALVWVEASLLPTRNISNSLMQPKGFYITNSSDVYVVNGGSNGRVDWWTWIGTIGNFATNGNETCFSLVVDLSNNFYCSFSSGHFVIKRSLNISSNTTMIVAGNSSAGSTPFLLYIPKGLLITFASELYVADCGNDRVQLFPFGQLAGATMAGNGAPGTISLSCPVAVTLDGYGYLFIVDQNNHRIVGGSFNGFRCVVGCSGQNGSATSQLQFPRSVAFDMNGNLMVGDRGNARVQEFALRNQYCSK